MESKGVNGAPLYSQYCAFSEKKNGEWMASHPEDLHSSIRKAAEYLCDALENAKWMDESNDDFHRVFFWQPVIVLQKDLYLYQECGGAEASLQDIGHGRLEYNFHFRGQPKTVVVDFVTEASLGEFIDDVLQKDDVIEETIFSFRTGKS